MKHVIKPVRMLAFKEKKLSGGPVDAPRVSVGHQGTVSSNQALAYGYSISFSLKTSTEGDTSVVSLKYEYI